MPTQAGNENIPSHSSTGLAAIIGGTGLDWRSGDAPIENARDERVSTRWGTALVTLATCGGRDLVFLHRHAAPEADGGRVPPHAINYRANIAALKALGVTAIFASTAVGSLRPEWKPGALVLLDDFFDCTSSRAKTFFDSYPVHVDVTQPYCPHARSFLLQAARVQGAILHDGGTYICTDGPRFETPGEIRLFASWGADVVGMTGVPEVVLAREASISYAGLSIVTNLAAGISPQPLTQGEVLDAMKTALPQVTSLFLHAATRYVDDPQVLARRATAEFATPHFDPDRVILAP
jgi:5'-methylthioadenosine phosphorylase